MARNTIVEIVDDLDGSKNAEEVSFSFQGTDYTIDLSRKNLAAFEKAIQPYLAAASKAPKSKSRSTSRRTSTKAGVDLAAVRAWANEAGIEVSSRGRVAQHVVDQYNAAAK